MSNFKEIDFIEVTQLIQKIESEFPNSIHAYNKIIDELEIKIAKLDTVLISYKFETIEEEISFFKEKKPQLISKLLYYNKMCQIESNLPIAKEKKIEVIFDEIKMIVQFEQENSLFNHYFRSGKTHNDHRYFTRKSFKNKRQNKLLNTHYNPDLSSLHTVHVAQILANESIIKYLENKLNQIQVDANAVQKNFNWTASKIDLIELIYSLRNFKAINNGEVEIKEIADYFSQVFNIDIREHVYRYYIDIKNRKTKQTKFLNALSQELQKKFDDEI